MLIGQPLRVVVVGAGAMGAAAAWELARRGCAVTLLDQFGIGNDLASSSASETRIFRLAHVDRADVRLAVQALELWHELEREAGERVLYPSGLLQRGAFALRMAEALRAEGVTVHDLDHRQVARAVPRAAPVPGHAGGGAARRRGDPLAARAAALRRPRGARRRRGLRPRAGDRPAAARRRACGCSRSAGAWTPTSPWSARGRGRGELLQAGRHRPAARAGAGAGQLLHRRGAHRRASVDRRAHPRGPAGHLRPAHARRRLQARLRARRPAPLLPRDARATRRPAAAAPSSSSRCARTSRASDPSR